MNILNKSWRVSRGLQTSFLVRGPIRPRSGPKSSPTLATPMHATCSTKCRRVLHARRAHPPLLRPCCRPILQFGRPEALPTSSFTRSALSLALSSLPCAAARACCHGRELSSMAVAFPPLLSTAVATTCSTAPAASSSPTGAPWSSKTTAGAAGHGSVPVAAADVCGQTSSAHLGVSRGHQRVRAGLPVLPRYSSAAGVASLAGTGPPPTASVSLRCSLREEEEEGPTCKRETNPGGFLHCHRLI
jgi:hypothetical protein